MNNAPAAFTAVCLVFAVMGALAALKRPSRAERTRASYARHRVCNEWRDYLSDHNRTISNR